MYIRIDEEGNPVRCELKQLRKLHPQTSFPDVMTEAIASEFNLIPFTDDEKPSYDELTEKIVFGGFVQRDGSWYRTFEVQRKELGQAIEEVRAHRDKLLAQSDSFMLSDRDIDPRIADYRQALRDITDQDGYPYSVEWPNAPF